MCVNRAVICFCTVVVYGCEIPRIQRSFKANKQGYSKELFFTLTAKMVQSLRKLLKSDH